MTESGLSLDSGALIAYECGDKFTRALLRRASRLDVPIHVVAGVVAQVWRGGPRQAELGRLLGARGLHLPVMDAPTARVVGELCGRSGHHDIVDVHVVVDAALHGHQVVTSDAGDLRRVDPELAIIEV